MNPHELLFRIGMVLLGGTLATAIVPIKLPPEFRSGMMLAFNLAASFVLVCYVLEMKGAL